MVSRAGDSACRPRPHLVQGSRYFSITPGYSVKLAGAFQRAQWSSPRPRHRLGQRPSPPHLKGLRTRGAKDVSISGPSRALRHATKHGKDGTTMSRILGIMPCTASSVTRPNQWLKHASSVRGKGGGRLFPQHLEASLDTTTTSTRHKEHGEVASTCYKTPRGRERFLGCYAEDVLDLIL